MRSVVQNYRRIRAWISRPRLVVQERAVTIDESDRCRNPIFLIGLHRSGTSLMRRVFNAHPEIACPPETFFISRYAAMLDDDEVFAGYRGFGYDREAMRRHLARLASDLHETFRLSQKKRRWADKTPSYTAILPSLREMFGAEARFVMIYRHPFDVARSVQQRGWNLGGMVDPATDESTQFAAILAHMQEMYKRQMEFEHAHPEVCVRVHYEDVVYNPDTTLRKKMAAIGEAFHPQMLEHHLQPHNFGTEDPIARGTSGFRASHGNWVIWNEDEKRAAKAALGAVVDNLGYSTDPVSAAERMKS